jgi:hypoxanthine-DNA glycosylase
MARLIHPWEAVFDERSRVLILGTFPSPRSRVEGFPYGHPQNLFWQTMANVLDSKEPPRDAACRREWLLEHRVALWDVLHACDIEGASDASIKNPEPNLFAPLLAASDIRAIFATGRAATRLFNRLCAEEAGMQATYLPSTSPANCAMRGTPEFLRLWSQLTPYLCNGYW